MNPTETMMPDAPVRGCPPHPDDDRAAVRRTARAAAVLCTMLACTGTALAADYAGSIVASGLNNPRGLAFGPDGALYIAEAGLPGGAGPSTPVRGAPSVYTETGSITRYEGGVQTRIVTGLPSIYSGNEVSGPQGIAFGSNGARYTVFGAGGVDPAVRFTDLAPGGAGLGRVVSTTTGSGDVAGFETTNNPAGGALDSNPWHIAAIAGGVLVTDAGGNSLLKVADDGSTSLVASFASRSIGGPGPSDPVPTGIAVGPDGAYYVGELTGFPFTPGAAQIYQLQPGGAMSVFATGFTNITDLAFGADGSLYVLEYDANGLLAPGNAGALIRLAPNGQRTTIFSDGLVGPTGLAIGPDGAFYVSNHGAEAGLGEVLRIAAVPEPGSWALMLAGLVAVGAGVRRRSRSRSR